MYVGVQVKEPLYFHIPLKFEFSRHIFVKSSNFKLHENLSTVIPEYLHADGRTDRYEEASSHFPLILRTRLKTKFVLGGPVLINLSQKQRDTKHRGFLEF
jgi:hypothetical protein